MNNNMLPQKSFSKSAIGTVKNENNSSKNSIGNARIRPSKLLNNQNINIKKHITKTISITKIIYISLFILFAAVNYFVLKKIDFEAESTLDYIELVIMIIVGAFSGIGMFHSQFESRDGYIFRYIISFAFGFIGDFMGLGISFVLCLILYVVLSIGGWFFGYN